MRQVLQQLFAGVFQQAGQHGAHNIIGTQFSRPATNTQNNAGSIQIGVILQQAGVFQYLLGQLQRDQLHRLNLRYGIGWDAELQWIEQNIIDESTPLAVDLVRRIAVGVKPVFIGKPVGGYLAYRIVRAENILPVALSVVCTTRQQRGDAHDGNIQRFPRGRLVTTFRRCIAVQRRLPFMQEPGATSAHPLVQSIYRQEVVIERHDLTDHVDAFALLLCLVDLNQCRTRFCVLPADPLGRHPQPSNIALIQSLAHLLWVQTLRFQTCLLLQKCLVVMCRRHSNSMAASRIRDLGVTGRLRNLLKFWHHGTGSNGFLGENVRRPHQDTGLCAALRQRSDQRRYHRCAHRIMDAPGEQQFQLGEILIRQPRAQQGVYHRGP